MKKSIIFDISNHKKQIKMIKAFKIYKEGMTTNWVTILIPQTEFNDIVLNNKINKYLFLGYKIEMI